MNFALDNAHEKIREEACDVARSVGHLAAEALGEGGLEREAA